MASGSSSDGATYTSSRSGSARGRELPLYPGQLVAHRAQLRVRLRVAQELPVGRVIGRERLPEQPRRGLAQRAPRRIGVGAERVQARGVVELVGARARAGL